jgi:hypothetical protein
VTGRSWAGAVIAIAALHAAPAFAQHSHAAMDSMPGMSMEEHMHMGEHEHAMMTGRFGPYPLTREASGTAWQPDDAEHTGIHFMSGPWMLMVHGMADLVWDHQGGPRGDEKTFSSNMLMGMAQRPLGPGTFGLRAMMSAEPGTIGKEGYPLLLQTGETADGVTPLIDRQHPHDLFMELAGSYSVSHGLNSVFVYGGLPGEPALGPPAYMHRFSAANIPAAPITHHWLDSSHITYGVLTAGGIWGDLKLEGSAFRGREPDQNRWDIEAPKLDSYSFRLSINPAPQWAVQGSFGYLHSPEQLEPDVNQDRTTFSVMYQGRWEGGSWQGTLAWGRNVNMPGHVLGAFLTEAAARLGDAQTFMARFEHVAKDELFAGPDTRAGVVYQVGELTAGYRYDFWRVTHAVAGLGVTGTISLVPDALHGEYGTSPTAGMVFAHVAIR